MKNTTWVPSSRASLLPACIGMSVGPFVMMAALLPLSTLAQSTPAHTPAHRPVHRTKPGGTTAGGAAAGAVATGQPKLPATIPPAPGPMHTAYEMRYVDIKVGTGPPALPDKTYTVHYTGWLYDGTKFDSSVDRGQPFDFPQGQKRVITGWDTGFEGMRVGGKRRLFVPYQLAYGEIGRDPIPPKANLIFDVELLAVDGVGAATPAPAQ